MSHLLVLLLAVAWLGACEASEPGDPASGGGRPESTSGTGGLDLPSGKFAGTYEVPVPPELEAAASFAVEEIEWRFEDGQVALRYDLPLGLVGKPLRVRFEGPFDEVRGVANLTGDAGTATCTVAAGTVECSETMPGLLPIDVDFAVVEELARQQYAGPVEDRLEVARIFASDPIGIAHIDVDAPLEDDGPTN